MKVRDYKDLFIWKKGIDIAEAIYDLTEKYPKNELYGIVSQMRRCSVSIPSNIAEGFSRHYTKEYIRFLFISRGSCSELETLLILSEKLEYITSDDTASLSQQLETEGKMLTGLIRKLNGYL